jgi:nucleotide-binding universal stress UspA family protein
VFSRILVPTDFSPRCGGALQYAEALVAHFGSELLLLNVIPAPLPMYIWEPVGEIPPSPETQEKYRQYAMEKLLEFAPEVDGQPVRRLLLEGDAAACIVRCAAVERADLIVMPTHGHGPFRRFLLGSVTAKVIHDTSCPVWTGPHMEQAPDHKHFAVERVVCAVDLGPDSPRVLETAARLASEFRACLRLVHAIPASSARTGGFYFDPDWRMDLIAESRERIERLRRDLAPNAEVAVETGDVAPAISDAARQFSAHLVVIGRGHSAGIAGRLHTHAYAILRDSPCPVLAC